MRRAFTLIEMIAVIVILALLSTAAAMSFSRPLQATRARDAVNQICALDASARQAARRFGKPVQIIFDLADHTIQRRERDAITFSSALPAGGKIDEIRTSARRESLGEVFIDCSASGMSRTYAVHVVGPQLDRWVLFAGLTGQITQITDVAELDSIFPPTTGGDDVD